MLLVTVPLGRFHHVAKLGQLAVRWQLQPLAVAEALARTRLLDAVLERLVSQSLQSMLTLWLLTDHDPL